MRVADIMIRDVATVLPGTDIEDLCELFQIRNIHGVPVVNESGSLVGIVTQEDVIYGSMGLGYESREERDIPALIREATEGERSASSPVSTVSDIMTSPAIHVEEEASIQEVCRLMWTLRIHRIPVVRDGRVTGIVSSLDVVRAVTEGKVVEAELA